MRRYLIETFKIIKGISNHSRHFCNISPLTGNLLSRQISKPKSINHLNFFAHRVIYFWKKLPNQIENNKKVLRLN